MVAKGDDPFLLGPGPFFYGQSVQSLIYHRCPLHFQKKGQQPKKTPGKQPLRRQSSINLGEAPKKQPSPFVAFKTMVLVSYVFHQHPDESPHHDGFSHLAMKAISGGNRRTFQGTLEVTEKNDWMVLDWVLVFGSLFFL